MINNNKENILNLIRSNSDEDAKKLIKWVATDFVDIKKDTLGMYEFFSGIYDELFYEIIFNKIEISNNTKKLLETLATPIYKKTELEQNKILTRNRILKK